MSRRAARPPPRQRGGRELTAAELPAIVRRMADRIEELTECLPDVASWDELLAEG